MAFNYGNTLKTIFLVSFYVCVIPHSVILGAVTLFIQFWINKILLLRRSARPPQLGDALSHQLRNLLEYVPIIIVIGQLVFQYDLYG